MGEAYNAQYCGLLHQGSTTPNSDLSFAGWGASNDVIVNTSLSKNTWYQYSITFDGRISKIYRNGELLKTSNKIVRNTKGIIFKLGEVNREVAINADIDDLKIYDIALSDEEITSLYNNSKPVISTVMTKSAQTAATQKNPKIAEKQVTETNQINSKNVEVFSQGEKVLSNNNQQMNINQLPEGTYLLKITNYTSKKITAK